MNGHDIPCPWDDPDPEPVRELIVVDDPVQGRVIRMRAEPPPCSFPLCSEPAVGYWLPPGHYSERPPAVSISDARRQAGEFVHGLPRLHRCERHAPVPAVELALEQRVLDDGFIRISSAGIYSAWPPDWHPLEGLEPHAPDLPVLGAPA